MLFVAQLLVIALHLAVYVLISYLTGRELLLEAGLVVAISAALVSHLVQRAWTKRQGAPMRDGAQAMMGTVPKFYVPVAAALLVNSAAGALSDLWLGDNSDLVWNVLLVTTCMSMLAVGTLRRALG